MTRISGCRVGRLPVPERNATVCAAEAEPARAPHPPQARRIDHIGIATRDADDAAAWYVRTFGMRVTGDEIVDAAGVRLVYLSPGDGDATATAVQLLEPVAAGNISDFLDSHGEGFHHVCFVVDSINEVLTHTQQPDDTIFLGGRQRRACFLEDRPLGVLIELTETKRVSQFSAR